MKPSSSRTASCISIETCTIRTRNTEENLRAVLEANGIKFEDLSEAERAQVHGSTQRDVAASEWKAGYNFTESGRNRHWLELRRRNQTRSWRRRRCKKPIGKNQKEVVIELAALKGKGYPAAVNLDTGSGKPAAVAMAKPVASKTP